MGNLYRGGTVSGSINDALANTWVWNSTNGKGYELKPDGKTATLFLPANGSRNSGSNGGVLSNQGVSGQYWSSSVSATLAYALYFYSGDVYPANSFNRAAGFALRCIKN